MQKTSSEKPNSGRHGTEYDVEGLCESIEKMRRTAAELKERGDGIQAVEKNVDRILANIKMLELNISDVRDIL